MEHLPSITPLATAFCVDGNQRDVIDAAASTIAPNLAGGFPVVFENPSSGGGQYVTRKQMNGVLHIATSGEAARQNGVVNTFNPNLVAITGGYAQGAVLDFLDGGILHKVISLHGNNTVDFTKVGVNNIDWMYCDAATVSNKVFPDIANAQTLCDQNIDISSIHSSGRIGDIFTLNSYADYLVTFGISTKVVGHGEGSDVSFCIRNNASSSSSEDWVDIQSCMWVSGTEYAMGSCFGSLYIHGGNDIAVAVKNIASFAEGSNVWLTLKAFPLTF